jgi:hypothetical protein
MEAIENFLDTGPWDGKEFRMEMVKAGFCVSGSKAWAFFMEESGTHVLYTNICKSLIGTFTQMVP